MATAIQRRRGTTAQTANFTGLAGEITIDTDLNTIIVHDGSTAGGYRLAKYTEVQAAASGDIESVVAGDGLTGGATSGNATINVVGGNGITVSADAVAVNVSYIYSQFSAGGDLSYNSSTGEFSFTNDAGDIEGVTAGAGLTGGGTSGTVSLAVNDSYFDVTAGGTGFGANLEPSANNTYSLGSATNVWKDVFVGPASLNIGGTTLSVSSGQLQFGGSNVAVAGDAGSEGDTRGLFSATDAGGDGSFAYNSSTGAFTYTGPSASEVRAHFSAGTGVTLSSGQISIGQSVGTSDNVSFGDVTLSGNLTVNGTTTTINSTTVTVDDAFFRVNSDGADIDAGFEANVGGAIKQITYDTSENEWTFGAEPVHTTGGFEGDLTGDVTGTVSSIANHSTTNLSEGSNLYYTDTRARSAISVSGDLSYNSGTGVVSFTERTDAEVKGLVSATDAGGDGSFAYNSSTGVFTYTGPSASEVRAHLSAGGDLSYNSTTGVVSFTERTDSEVRGLFSAGGDLSYNSSTGVFSFTNDAGDIESVTAGSGLTGGGTSGNVTLNAVGGYGITVNADDIEVANSDIRGLFSAGGDLSYNSTTGVFSFTNDAGDIEGVTAGSGLTGGGTTGTVTLNIGAGTGITVNADDIAVNMAAFDTDDLGEGASNLYFTNARARSSVSATDAGGDGSFAYNSSTGVFTYTGPSAAEVRAHFSAGDGLDVTSGEFAVDNTVVRTTGAQSIAGTKTFSDDAIFSGNLTVNGTQTVLNTETLTVDDNVIILNNNATGAPSQNAGIQINRGDSADVTFQFNEGTDKWQFTNDGSTFYDLVIDTDDLSEGSSNLYFTNTRARSAISVSGDLAYNSGTGVVSFTERTDSEVRGLLSGGTGINYNSGTGVIALSDTGYVSGVTAGSGLTGGGTSGNVTVNAVGGFGITVNADDIEVANSDIRGLFSASGDLSYNSTTGVVSFTERTDSEVRGLFSASGDISYNSSTGVFSFTNDAGDIEGVTAGTGLSGGGTSGNVTLSLATSGVTPGTYGDSDSVAQVVVDAYGRVTGASSVDIGIAAGAVSGLAASATTDTTSASNISSGTLASARLPDLTVADFAAAAIQTGLESFADSDTVLMTAAAVQDKILSYGYTTTTGDITGVTAGSGLTGGGASGSVTLNVGAGSYITVAADTISVDATTTNTANKVVARDGSGNFAAGTITATATQAQYADLAEKYEADEELEPGTVVCFGGEKEITACDVEGHHAVAGVISTDPAHLMNNDCPGIALPVALAGRVPCKVVGRVSKGDLMVASSVKGHAKADNNAPAGRIIGKAIGSNEDGEGVVEVLVNMM